MSITRRVFESSVYLAYYYVPSDRPHQPFQLSACSHWVRDCVHICGFCLVQCSCALPAPSTRPAPHLRLFYSFVNFIEQNNITVIVLKRKHKILRMDVDVYIYITIHIIL